MYATAIGLLVALGCGMLIGLDRERRKGEGDDRKAAGIRSFTIAALSGAMAQSLQRPGLVAAGGLLVVTLTTVAYFKSRSRDPGLTTELALFATYLVGVQAMLEPALGAGCGVALAALLVARQRLHRFATHWLTSEELHDVLMLAALGLVVLPLVPAAPQPWLGGVNPRPLLALVLLILVLQGVGHVALRLAGLRFGLAVSGLVSGFVSSTATVAALGGRARHDTEQIDMLSCGAVLSSAATWIQVLLIAAAVSAPAAGSLAPVAVAGLAAALGVGALLFLAAGRESTRTAVDTAKHRPLRLREALVVALLLSIVTFAATLARRYFGAVGVFTTAALAGLADAHSPVASVVAMFAAAGLSEREMHLGVLLALTSNSASRVVVAFTTGGARYGARVSTGLLLALAGAWSAHLALS